MPYDRFVMRTAFSGVSARTGRLFVWAGGPAAILKIIELFIIC